MAYLDPGTGSFIIQLIIGGLVGIGVVVKMFWSNIVNIFNKGKNDPTNEEIQENKEIPN